MSLSSAKNFALRAARSQDEKEAIELLSKAILELAASIEDTDAKVKRINKSKDWRTRWREPHLFEGARERPVLAGSPLIFVLENSHFGHLKICFSAPLAPGSLPASSIRVRHMAQRGGLTALRERTVGLSGDGIIFLTPEIQHSFGALPEHRLEPIRSRAMNLALAVSCEAWKA
jgi:hypothetical protein